MTKYDFAVYKTWQKAVKSEQMLVDSRTYQNIPNLTTLFQIQNFAKKWTIPKSCFYESEHVLGPQLFLLKISM